MSSILKALRKLEEEKARRNGGSPDVARDILKRGPRRKSSVAWPVLLLAALLLASGLACYVLIENPLSATQPMASIKQAAGAPSAETPAVAIDPHPGERSVIRDLPKSPLRAVDKTAEGPTRPPTTAPLPKKATASVKEKTSPAPAEKASLDDPLPLLRLSGIAYQEERGARLAVVNDLPVMEGTMIEGARVEEIFQDRVRFVYAGRSVEVFLGQSTATK